MFCAASVRKGSAVVDEELNASKTAIILAMTTSYRYTGVKSYSRLTFMGQKQFRNHSIINPL